MADISLKIPLTADLWDALRGNLRSRSGIPTWVGNLCEMSFDKVQALPDRLRTPGTSKPQLTSLDRRSFLSGVKRTFYNRSTPEQAERHRRRLAAIEPLGCERIISVRVVTSDRCFHCYFDEDTHEPVDFEEFSGQFLVLPRWREILLAWRVSAGVAVTLGIAAYLASPSPNAALVVFSVAFLFYLLAISLYGIRHAIEGAVPALMIALLGGLLWGAFLRAEARKHLIEEMHRTHGEMQR